MKAEKLSDNSYEIWNMIGSIHHSVSLIRQQELKEHRIPVRQLYVLRAIRDLGPDATLFDIAKRVERQPHVISRQTVLMEKDGLIQRKRETPKSNRLNLKLTPKGLNIIQAAQKNESIEAIFSSLSEEDRRQAKLILKKILTSVREYASSRIKDEVDFWLK
jgi:DNA-binding MarR family transcriptional regulator